MGLIRLTVRNARRTPVRGLLTLVAVASTLVAFLLLRTLHAGWTDRIEQTPNDRVVTRNKIGWSGSLPVRYAESVRGLPGVKSAIGLRRGGLKLPTDNGVFFESWAVDNAQTFVDMHYELSAPAGQKEAFAMSRQGALVAAEFAQEQGWHVGDTLHFKARETPGECELVISGIVHSTRVGFAQRVVFFHWDYFKETLPLLERDHVTFIVAQVEDPKLAARVAKAIDIHFDVEDVPTFSQADKAFNTAVVGRIGAILDAMNIVSVLVLLVVVLLLGNTVAMSTRERTREYGTLRAIGFMPGHIAVFVLGEAAVLGLAGGVLGLVLAYPLVEGPLSRYLVQEMAVAPLRIAGADAALALILGGCLGLIAAGLPASRAARLQVTESLCRVA
jgi:putative ABC transport system permease protein